MHILIYAHQYLPIVGGLQYVTDTLAREFLKKGHNVTVITNTTEDGQFERLPYRVIRRCSLLRFIGAFWECDIFWHASLSLKSCFLPILIKKPWFVTHHMLLEGPFAYLKRAIAKKAQGIAVSKFMAEHVGDNSIVIGNPYRDDIFFVDPNSVRNKDVVFLGRLIKEKGCDVLLDAISYLRESGFVVSASVIGSGDELYQLKLRTTELQLSEQVSFCGTLVGPSLADILNRHKLIVIPSVWEEPFGIVALEGMACGCVPIATKVGGLQEVVAELDTSILPYDYRGLADRIRSLLQNPELLADRSARMKDVLQKYSAASVAEEYLKEFERAIEVIA